MDEMNHTPDVLFRFIKQAYARHVFVWVYQSSTRLRISHRSLDFRYLVVLT